MTPIHANDEPPEPPELPLPPADAPLTFTDAIRVARDLDPRHQTRRKAVWANFAAMSAAGLAAWAADPDDLAVLAARTADRLTAQYLERFPNDF